MRALEGCLDGRVPTLRQAGSVPALLYALHALGLKPGSKVCARWFRGGGGVLPHAYPTSTGELLRVCQVADRLEGARAVRVRCSNS